MNRDNFHWDGELTIEEISERLTQPIAEVKQQMAGLEIKPDFSVGGIGIFSQASFLRIKSAIMGTANKKAARAI